jgi:2-oxoglutarate ferredoxin oxidoreductase subunit beta
MTEKMANIFDNRPEMAWCPGCGNYAIRNLMLQVLGGMQLERENLVFVSGIGQAAKAPQYYNVSYFNGLHGRALPAATGIKAANPRLKVIVESGDGDMYGEGGNHFLHAIRRNPDLTVIVHNNMVYGLTKGQASPTTPLGTVTPVQVHGVAAAPLNPLALAISLDASFVARVSVHKPEEMKAVIRQAIEHRGFSLVDVFQSCVTFNKVNTLRWFTDNTSPVPPDHDPSDRRAAFAMALREDPWPIGIFYRHDRRATFEENQRLYQSATTPLYLRRIDTPAMRALIGRFR